MHATTAQPAGAPDGELVADARAWSPLPQLAAAIVCKNNQDTIGRTLDSLRGLASEIVAIDSGSTDDTIRMLEACGARVVRSPWLGHVKTKQLALETCTRAWVLCIDSDESLEPGLRSAIRAAIADRDDRADAPSRGVPGGFEVNRMTYYRGRPLRHVWQPEWRLRLVRRADARWGGLDPHDKLELNSGAGPAVRLKGVLRHDSFPTFVEHLRKQHQHATTMARSLHASGARGSYARLLLSPAGAMFKQLVLKRGVLDGYAGWLAAASTACAALIKHAALIELSRSPHPSSDGGTTAHGGQPGSGTAKP